MAAETRDSPLTMYLVYKIATRSGDFELASDCLSRVSSAGDSQKYLYACVIDAYKSENKLCAVEAMKKLIDSYGHHTPKQAHIPALFRCTIRLLHRLLDEGAGQESENLVQWQIVEDLCKIFDTGESSTNLVAVYFTNVRHELLPLSRRNTWNRKRSDCLM